MVFTRKLRDLVGFLLQSSLLEESLNAELFVDVLWVVVIINVLHPVTKGLVNLVPVGLPPFLPLPLLSRLVLVVRLRRRIYQKIIVSCEHLASILFQLVRIFAGKS